MYISYIYIGFTPPPLLTQAISDFVYMIISCITVPARQISYICIHHTYT